MHKGESYTEKQKHVYSEIVNYVKMLDEEKTKLDLSTRLQKDDKFKYLTEKLGILKSQIRLNQRKFKDLCECRGKEGCECDVAPEAEADKEGADVEKKVDELKEELIEKLRHEKAAVLEKISRNTVNVNQTMNQMIGNGGVVDKDMNEVLGNLKQQQ